MVDRVSPVVRSKIMQAIKSKNTRPELIVRKILTQRGYRYRLHDRELPGHPDIIFKSRKLAIFVHGCFWHSHQDCRVAHVPPGNYWYQKLSRTQERDKLTVEKLHALGWKALIVWECETKNLMLLEEKITEFLV